MKKAKIVLTILLIVFLANGCIDKNGMINKKINNEKVNLSGEGIKVGDSVSIDFILYADGRVSNTNIEKVAKENNISIPQPLTNMPLIFKVGEGRVIKGLEEGVIGMRLGESKNLTIPPEKAFQIDSGLIKVIPIIEKIPATRILSKKFVIPEETFDYQFGPHKAGDIVQIPETDINATIKSINSSAVSLEFNLKDGDVVNAAPFKEMVENVDENNITLKAYVTKNETINWTAWNTTIIDINSKNVTLKHNYIPDTILNTPEGELKVHFNETSIILDQNQKLAGKTLIFNVTIKSIN